MGDSGYKVGQVVQLTDGRTGTIRYLGPIPTKPKDQTWVGLELEDGSGKNDGTVLGQRLFTCEPQHGIVCMPRAIDSVIQAAPAPAAAPPAPAAASRTTTAAKRTSMLGAPKQATRTTTTGRPPSIAGPSATRTATGAAAKRQSIVDPTKARENLNSSSPTPVSRTTTTRATGATGPTSAPARTTRPTAVSTTSTRAPTSAPAAATKRTSLLGRTPTAAAAGTTAATRTTRTSTIGAAASRTVRPSPITSASSSTTRAPAATRTSATRTVSTASTASRPTVTARKPSAASSVEDVNAEQEEDDQEDNAEDGEDLVAPSRQPGASSNDAPPRSAGLSRPTTHQLSAQNRKIEDLETQVRVLEEQQAKSRDSLKEMERIRSDKERLEVLIKKLEDKIKPQSEEIAQLRRSLKEASAKAEEAEHNQLDIDDAIELATIDRETAEEIAEACRSDLDVLRRAHEELKLEAEILRAENEDLSREMSPEERNSVGFAQLEKSNERLREALIRLRDMTQETETDFKDRVKELEEEVDEYSGFKSKFEECSDRLQQSETLVEELKQQLEGAQGSEDMIEEITEKNMALTEQVEDLRAAVLDLEQLREISDELEATHIEQERSMQEDIDYRDSLILQSAQRCNEQETEIEQLEYTVSRFRELVTTLNSDLEEMKASQQITEAEHSELSSRSKAMMDLNLRLQQSASKTQVKIIDTELRRLEAQEASDQLAITQRFLPDSYLQHKNSTTAFLCYKRISFKALLLHGLFKERLGVDPMPGREEDVFATCELLDQLTWVSETCRRFVGLIASCPLDTWQRMGSTAYDLEPVERAFNGWIDALKREDLRESQCSSELQRTMSVLEHLGERYFGEDLVDYAEQVHLHAVMAQAQLNSAAAVLSQIKNIAKVRVVLPTDADEEDERAMDTFNTRADAIIEQVRSASVIATKSLQELNELTTRSLTLEPSTQSTVESTQNAVDAFTSACREAGFKVAAAVNEDTRTESLTYEHIVRAISSDDSMPFSSLTTQVASVIGALQSFANLTTTFSTTVEFDVPPSAEDMDAQTTPWSQLSEEIKAQASANADLDAEISRLNDTLTERSTAIAMKDKSLSELGVTIEVLQKRADDGSKATTRARDLEAELDKMLKKRDSLEERVQQKEDEVKKLRAERESWTASGAAAGGTDGSNAPFDEARMARVMEDMAEGGYIPAKTAQELDFLHAELEATRSIVRQLRQAATDASFQGAQSDGILGALNAEKPADSREQQLLDDEREALSAMKALRDIVNRSDVGITKMKKVERSERLKWRPAHERLGWQVGVKREEWETWREWVQDVAKQEEQQSDRKERLAEKASRSGDDAVKPHILARLRLRSPPTAVAAGLNKGLPLPGEIKIVDPTEWEGLGARLGL